MLKLIFNSTFELNWSAGMIVVINASTNEIPKKKSFDEQTKRERAGELQKTRQRHLNAQPLYELSNWNGSAKLFSAAAARFFPSLSLCFLMLLCLLWGTEKNTTNKNDMTFQIFNTFLFAGMCFVQPIRSGDTYANFSYLCALFRNIVCRTWR